MSFSPASMTPSYFDGCTIRQALEGSWTAMWKDGQKAREVNDRLMMAERAFTDREGLKGRSWYKHLVCFYCSVCCSVEPERK